MPLDIYDKAAGIDYFAAETALAKLFRPQLVAGSTQATLSFNPNQLPKNVQQFWTDEIQPLKRVVPTLLVAAPARTRAAIRS